MKRLVIEAELVSVGETDAGPVIELGHNVDVYGAPRDRLTRVSVSRENAPWLAKHLYENVRLTIEVDDDDSETDERDG